MRKTQQARGVIALLMGIVVSSGPTTYACPRAAAPSSILNPISESRRPLEQLITGSECNFFTQVVRGEEVEPYYNGLLSPLWAQEFVGADLAKGAIRDFETQINASLPEVPLGIWDGGYDLEKLDGVRLGPNLDRATEATFNKNQHGTMTAYIATSDTPVSTSEKSVLDSLQHFGAGTVDNNEVASHRSSLAHFNEHPPRVLNGSIGFSYYDFEVEESLRQLDRSGTSLVFASGNGGIDIFNQNSFRTLDNTIFVGSLSAQGSVSHFSQSHPRVSVVAPAGEYITSIAQDGKPARYGRTSAATPLVSGALANAYSILPSLTPGEAKRLLEFTASPNFNTVHGDTNTGAGTLNAFKMVKVALLLRALGFNEKTPEERQSMLSDPQNRDFSREFSSEALQGARRRLMDPNAPCEDREQALELLRQDYLLNHRLETIDALAQFYRSQGFDMNASFVEAIVPEKARANMLAQTNLSGLPTVFNADLNVSEKRTITEAAPLMGVQGRPILEALYDSTSGWERREVLRAEAQIPASEYPLILRAAATAPARTARSALQESRSLPSETRLAALNAGIRHDSVSVRLKALEEARQMGTDGAEIINYALANEKSYSVWNEALALIHLAKDRKSALSLLSLVAIDAQPLRLKAALTALGNLGEEARPLIQEIQQNYSDREVQVAVVEALGDLGGADSETKLEQFMNEQNRSDQMDIALLGAYNSLPQEPKLGFAQNVYDDENRTRKVREAALEALLQDDRYLARSAYRAWHSNNKYFQRVLMQNISRLPDNLQKRYLKLGIQSDDIVVLARSAQAIADSRDAYYLPFLEEALRESDFEDLGAARSQLFDAWESFQ